MKRRTLVQTFALWLIGPLAFLGLMILGAILDHPRTEQLMADDAADAVNAARADAHQAWIDRRICIAELGPGTVALRTHQGDLVCRPAAQIATSGGEL